MRNLFFIIPFLYSSLLIGQNETYPDKVVTPPEKVAQIFQKEYPGKTPSWTLKYAGDDDDEIRYEAKFKNDKNTNALAVYDNWGVLKAFELEIPLSQLPQKAQAYLKKNYPANAIKEVAVVVDDRNKTTYEVGVVKNSRFYDVVFDKNGSFDVIIEKD